MWLETKSKSTNHNKKLRQEIMASDEVDFGYADEPLADEEWVAQYQEEVKATEELDQRLNNRFDGTQRISGW